MQWSREVMANDVTKTEQMSIRLIPKILYWFRFFASLRARNTDLIVVGLQRRLLV